MGGNTFFIIFIIMLLVVWLVAGGFITKANTKLSKYKNENAKLKSAHTKTFWGAFITWFLVGVAIIMAIFFFFGPGRAAMAGRAAKAKGTQMVNKLRGYKGPSKIILFVLFLSLVLVAVTGGLAASAAADIKSSGQLDPNTPGDNLNTAYDSCTMAAVLSFLTAGFILIIIIWYYIRSAKKAKENKAILANAQQQLSNVVSTALNKT